MPTIAHGGSAAGYRADFIRFPAQRLGVACLCNLATVNPGELTRQVAEIFLGDKDVSLSEQELRTCTGLYWNRDEESGRKIIFADSALRAVSGATQYEMTPIGDGTFVLRTGPRVRLQFTHADTPGSRRLIVTPIDGGSPQTLAGVEQVTPTAAQLHELAGAYRSDEMDAVYRFVVDKDALVLKRLRAAPMRLEPAMTDVFTGPVGTVRFTRDRRRRVAGFVIDAGRIRNVRFWRDVPAARP